MFKKSLFLGISSGILAGVAGIIFEKVYANAFYTDFSNVTATIGGSIGITTSPMTIMLISIFTGVLAAIFHAIFIKWLKAKGDAVFSLLFTMVSFMSIVIPISATLPLDVDDTVLMLFPGFAMTLHFFPALVWFALKPLFFGTKTH